MEANNNSYFHSWGWCGIPGKGSIDGLVLGPFAVPSLLFGNQYDHMCNSQKLLIRRNMGTFDGASGVVLSLLMGVHPTVDHLGRALGKGSSFALVKGQQLAHQGYRCVIWSIQGDQDFSSTLGLPHWSYLHPCWGCDCFNNPEIPFAKNW